LVRVLRIILSGVRKEKLKKWKDFDSSVVSRDDPKVPEDPWYEAGDTPPPSPATKKSMIDIERKCGQNR
jgi:hypothetical protein